MRTLWFLFGLAAFLSLPAQAEDAPPSPHQLSAHLASYHNRADAERGWHVLTDAYSGVLYFKQAVREVDLPGKGHFFRLYADGEPDMVTSLCQSMKAKKLYCALHRL